MLENKVSRVTATIVATAMLNGCIAPQTYSWKTESIVNTTYKEVGEETATEIRYKVSHSVSESGTLSIKVKKQDYEVEYDVLQPIETQKQREYAFGRSKSAAMWADIGVGTIALGILLESVTTSKTGCFDLDGTIYCKEVQGSPGAHLVLTTGILTTGVSGLFYWMEYSKRSRPTENYQTVEVELDTRERRPEAEHVLKIVPAISAPLEMDSSYFTINGAGHTLTTKTNVMGNVTMQLYSSSPHFAFTLDQIAEIDAAQQLREAGYKAEQYLPLLEQAAVPVFYDVRVQTKATDGKNADVTIPIKGYEISQKALEQVVMGL